MHRNPAIKPLCRSRPLHRLLDHIVGASQFDALRGTRLHLEVTGGFPGRATDRNMPSVVGQVGYDQAGRYGRCQSARLAGASGVEVQARRDGPESAKARGDRNDYPGSWTVPGNHD